MILRVMYGFVTKGQVEGMKEAIRAGVSDSRLDKLNSDCYDFFDCHGWRLEYSFWAAASTNVYDDVI